MDFERLEHYYRQALDNTVVHRERQSSLFTFGATRLPYYFVAESAINKGDTVIRKGEISTDKPALFTPDNLPNFSGFGDEYEGHEKEMSVVLGRVFHLSGLHYKHEGNQLEVVTKEMNRVIDEYQTELDQSHNHRTAIISGPEDCWALSLVVYASKMTQKSAESNMNDIMQRGGGGSNNNPFQI